MRKNIKGIHRVKFRRAAGALRFYYYAWRGGPLFWTADHRPAPDPMSPAMIEAFEAAARDHAETRRRARLAERTVAGAMEAFKASDEFRGNAAATRREALRYLDIIGAEFGPDEIEAFEAREMRADVKRWHRSMKATPRAADYALGELVRLLNFAVDEGMISGHVAAGIARIHRPRDLSGQVWTPDEIEALLAAAPAHFSHVIHMARLFGLRRGDLCGLAADADKGATIEATTSKSRHRREIVLPVTPAARAVLDAIHADRAARQVSATALLTNSRGRPWTPDGLSSVFDKAKRAAGIDKRLHDFRGTAVTHFCAAGFSDAEIAEMVGWSPQNVAAIRRKYVSKSNLVSAAIARLERAESGPGRTVKL